MESIVSERGFNIGGNARIYCIRHNKILSDPIVKRMVVQGDLSIDGYWEELPAVMGSIEYKQATAENDQGVGFNCELTLVIPQETLNKNRQVKRLRSEPLAFLIIDNATNTSWLIGNRREYLKLERDFTTGSNPANLNHTRLTAVGKLKYGAIAYAGSMPVDPAQEIESVSFNLGGNVEVFFADQERLLEVPVIRDSLVQGLITVNGVWLEIIPIPYSVVMRELESDQTPGAACELVVELAISGRTPELSYKLQLLRERKIVMLIRDASTGWHRLIGNHHEFLKFNQSYASGGKATELNGSRITLAGQIKNGAVFYSDYIISDIAFVDQDGYFIVDSDGAHLMDITT